MPPSQFHNPHRLPVMCGFEIWACPRWMTDLYGQADLRSIAWARLMFGPYSKSLVTRIGFCDLYWV